MAAFEYEALDVRGNAVKGVLEGDAERQVRATLRDRGLTPLRVAAIRREEEKPGRRPGLRRGLSTADLALITRQFATLVRAGLTIEESLNALIEQAETARQRAVLAGVRGRVLEGQSLARALTAFPNEFPPIYRHMVDAGEQSGKLDTVLERLADYTEQRQALQQQLILAFVYPALVTVFAIGIVSALLVFVVPKVTQVFVNSGQTLPVLTRILIAVSDFVRAGGALWLLGLVALALAARAALKQPVLRLRWHAFLLRLPILGRLIRSIHASRLTSTLGILASSGIPLLSALQHGVEVVTNLPMRAAVEDALRQVREGGSLSRALGKSKLFPPMVIHLIGSGEASGRLDVMLLRAAEAQSQDLRNWVAAFTKLLEPVLILLMGAMVLFIVLAILLPIFDMNQLLK